MRTEKIADAFIKQKGRNYYELYRICLMLLVLALLAGTAFYYMTNEKETGEPKDGMLVQEVISEESRNYA